MQLNGPPRSGSTLVAGVRILYGDWLCNISGGGFKKVEDEGARAKTISYKGQGNVKDNQGEKQGKSKVHFQRWREFSRG